MRQNLAPAAFIYARHASPNNRTGSQPQLRHDSSLPLCQGSFAACLQQGMSCSLPCVLACGDRTSARRRLNRIQNSNPRCDPDSNRWQCLVLRRHDLAAFEDSDAAELRLLLPVEQKDAAIVRCSDFRGIEAALERMLDIVVA